MSLSDEIVSIFEGRGATVYCGERISMTEHALQTAFFAREASAPRALVVAALLHDIGHLVEAAPDEFAKWTVDARHEDAGSRWLALRLGAQIAGPVRLHVAAKRYLCATDPDYVHMLSPASVATLKLQGGPMSPAEISQFETQPGFEDAVRIRRWDDQGKVLGLQTPGLADYRDLIDGFAQRNP